MGKKKNEQESKLLDEIKQTMTEIGLKIPEIEKEKKEKKEKEEKEEKEEKKEKNDKKQKAKKGEKQIEKVPQGKNSNKNIKNGEKIEKNLEKGKKQFEKKDQNEKKEKSTKHFEKDTKENYKKEVPKKYIKNLDSFKNQNGDTLIIDNGSKTQVDEKKSKSFKKSRFQLQEGKWYELGVEINLAKTKVEEYIIAEKMEYAKRILNEEISLFENDRKLAKSEIDWVNSVLQSGTLSDKIAALTLLVQEAPLFRLSSLKTLIAMTKKKGRREAILAVEAVKDLMISDLLPDRKLHDFQEFDVVNETDEKRILLYYYESELKKCYLELIINIEAISHDVLGHIRSKAISHIFDLLSEKPEQEKNLLAMLVNKLGDLDNKVASKVNFLMQQLLLKHPKMKIVVIREVENLIFRTNIQIRAQYYAMVFLNQIILTLEESHVAQKLVDLYFQVYTSLIQKEDDAIQTKLLSALLTGVNRAFPFGHSDSSTKIYEKHIETLYRICHTANFNASIQSMTLLYQISTSHQANLDRFFRLLYESLFDNRLYSTSKHNLYLNLIFKSLKADTNIPRIQAFFKRIIQVCSTQTPSFICGSLMILSELIKIHPEVRTLITQPEEVEENFVDVKEGEEGEKTSRQGKTIYDINKRDPRFCHAEHSCLWEITKFLSHYHPSVSRFAQCVLEGEPINYKGNPYVDFTNIHFLDKFVYKNPKKVIQRGDSLMQPNPSPNSQKKPINLPWFLAQNQSKLPSDEIFFYKYFQEKNKREKERKKKDKKTEEGEEFDDLGEDLQDQDQDDLDEELSNKGPKGAKKQREELLEDEGEGEGEGEDDDNIDDDGVDGVDDDDDDDDEFSYEDLGKQLGEEEEEGGEDPEFDESKMDDEKYLEELLLADMDNEDDDDDEGGNPFGDDDDDDDDDDNRSRSNRKSKKRGREDISISSDTFASAEDFADLLEGGDEQDPKSHKRQKVWEKSRSSKSHSKKHSAKKSSSNKQKTNKNKKKK